MFRVRPCWGQTFQNWELKLRSDPIAIFLILLLLGVFSLIGRTETSAPTLALAQTGVGIIKGKVLNKTGGEKPVSGQRVTLRKFVNQSPQEDSSAVTDAQGNFEFRGLSTSSKENYFVLLTYQGADYYTNPLVFKSGKKELSADIPVYDPTDSFENIKLKLHHIVVDLPESGHLHIREVLLFENTGDKTFVGSKEVSQGKKETLKFFLPKDASELKNEQGVFSQYVVTTEDGFADTMGFIPGQRQILYSYRITVDGSKYNFKRKIDYDAPEFSLFAVNKGLKVNAPKLTSQGTTQGEGGKEYLHFVGKNLKAGTMLSVELSNIPRGGGGIWQWILISILAFFIVFGFSYPFIRKRLARAGVEGVKKVEKVESSVSARPIEGEKNLEEERKTLLQEIANLDDQYEAGKISKENYEEKRTEKKKRLVELTNELKKA